MDQRIDDLQAATGLTFFDYQVEALKSTDTQAPDAARLCLYYKTGAGKSITAMACMYLWSVTEVLVIAPPSTHPAWVETGEVFNIDVTAMSHAKFRMPGTKVSRTQAIIADEMHLFGGHHGKGWKKLDRLAQSLQAPLVLASATPNYNDADRVYCIQHVLDPLSCRGGFLQFLYSNCITEQDPFSQTPKVLGFQRHADAAEYLSSLERVEYLADDLVYTIDDFVVDRYWPVEAQRFGYNARDHKMVASGIEEKHMVIQQSLIADDGGLKENVYEILGDLVGNATTPVLVFSSHSTVAEALSRSLDRNRVTHGLVTGKTTPKVKDALIAAFNAGQSELLVGTASLATGTDGMDKVCDTLIILDDTEDDSLRRQLIGRIMPRGVDADASKKQVHRIVLAP